MDVEKKLCKLEKCMTDCLVTQLELVETEGIFVCFQL